MNNLDIGFYTSIALRRLPLILAIALAVLLATVIAVRHLPSVYSASAKILAEEPQIPTELARSTVPTGAMTQLLILQQQITTRDALVALADKMDIYRGNRVKPTEEDIVGDLTGRIRFDQLQLDPMASDQGVVVFAVSFKAQSPTLAASVANELARMILATSQRERSNRAGSTLEFFNQKVASLDAELRRIDAAILKFKTENKDTLPESLSFRRNQQDSLQGRLASLENEEADLRTRRNALIANYTSTGQLSDAVPLSPEQQMLADLNRALAEQLTMFTEDSPNIKAIRTRIDALRKSIVVPPPGTGKKETDDRQRVSFGLDLQLTDINERLRAIAQEERDVTQRIDDLTRSIAATPASEMALNALLRSHENLQTQYKAAIAQRAEASTGEQIETRSDGQRFSLLEEATPPSKPTGLKRKLLILFGALGGLGLGAAFVLLLEVLNRKVRRPKDLSKLLQAEPLGTIPVIRTLRETRAARMRLGFAAFASAGVMPACLVAVHYYYMPLDLVFQKIISGFAWIGTT